MSQYINHSLSITTSYLFVVVSFQTIASLLFGVRTFKNFNGSEIAFKVLKAFIAQNENLIYLFQTKYFNLLFSVETL